MAKVSKSKMLASIRSKAVEDRTIDDYKYVILESVDGLAEYISMCPESDASEEAKKAYKEALFSALDPKTNTAASIAKAINQFNKTLTNKGFESKAITTLVDGIRDVVENNPEAFVEGSEVTEKINKLLDAAEAAGKIVVGKDYSQKLKDTLKDLKAAQAEIARLEAKQNDPNPEAPKLNSAEAKRLAMLEKFTRDFVAVTYKSIYNEEMPVDAVIDEEIVNGAIEHFTTITETAATYDALKEKFPDIKDFEAALSALNTVSEQTDQNGVVAANQLTADQIAMIQRVFGADATIESVVDASRDWKNQANAFNTAFGGDTVESVAYRYQRMQDMLQNSTIEEVLASVDNYTEVRQAKDDTEAKLARSESAIKKWKVATIVLAVGFTASVLGGVIASQVSKNKQHDPDPATLETLYKGLDISTDVLSPIVVADAGMARSADVEYRVSWTSDTEEYNNIRLSASGLEKFNAHNEANKVEYTDFATLKNASDFIVAYSSEYTPADAILTANQISPELLQNENGVVTWTTSSIQLSEAGKNKYNDYIKYIAENGEVSSAEAITNVGAVEITDFVKANDAATFGGAEYLSYMTQVINQLKSDIAELEDKLASSPSSTAVNDAVDALFKSLRAKYLDLKVKTDEGGKTVAEFVTTDENGDEKVVTIALSDKGASKANEASEDIIKTDAFESVVDALKAVSYIIEHGAEDYDQIKDILDKIKQKLNVNADDEILDKIDDLVNGNGNGNQNGDVSSGNFGGNGSASDVSGGENTNKNPAPKPGFDYDDDYSYKE